MPETNANSKRGLSLDIYAVGLSLVLALLVHFNLLPAITW